MAAMIVFAVSFQWRVAPTLGSQQIIWKRNVPSVLADIIRESDGLSTAQFHVVE